MARFKSSAALVALSLGVTACGPETNRLTPISNPTVYSVNQPVVERTNYILDLAAGGSGLPTAERARLADWFETLRLRYSDRVYVDEASYADPRTYQDIEEAAGEYGLLLSDGAPITARPASPGSVRVIVTRASASVPGCPIWEDELVGATEQTSTNYGCATQSNLAAMIADPNDLVLGQDGGGMRDSVQGNKAIELYRNRIPTGTGGLKKEKAGK